MLPGSVIADLSLLQVAHEIGWRVDAPFQVRLIIQPLVALLIGLRDGRMDVKAGTPPYLSNLIFNATDRAARMKGGLLAIARPLVVAVIMDVIVQTMSDESVSIPGALVVGGLVVVPPYLLARGLSNRLAVWRQAASAAKDSR